MYTRRMTRWILGILFFIVCFLCHTKLASASPQCDPDNPKMCASPLVKGERAPYSGQLLTPDLALALGLKADRCDAMLKIEREAAKKETKITVELERQLKTNCDRRCKLEKRVIRWEVDHWKEAAKVPWYEKPVFVATVTAVVVGGMFYGLAQVTR